MKNAWDVVILRTGVPRPQGVRFRNPMSDAAYHRGYVVIAISKGPFVPVHCIFAGWPQWRRSRKFRSASYVQMRFARGQVDPFGSSESTGCLLPPAI